MKTKIKVNSAWLRRYDAHDYEFSRQYVEMAKWLDVITPHLIVSGRVKNANTKWRLEKPCVKIQPVRLYRSVFEKLPLFITISLSIGSKIKGIFILDKVAQSEFHRINKPCEIRLETSSIELTGKAYPNRLSNSKVAVLDIEVFHINWHI